MQKIYVLEGLDCANCAMKIERQVAKVKGYKRPMWILSQRSYM